MDKVFSVFGKLVLAGAILLILIGGGFYFGRQTNTPSVALVTPTIAIKEVTKTITSVPSTIVSVMPTSEKKQVVMGSITGKVGYPSEGIPPLDIYAVSTLDKSKFYQVKTGQNISTFTINNIEAGMYIVFAYPQSGGTFAGGYSKAVPCGLTVDCKDHSLIPVEVKAGEATGGVDVRDWYAPEGTYPVKPN